MASVLFFVREASCLATAVVQMALKDPGNFLWKASERLRIDGRSKTSQILRGLVNRLPKREPANDEARERMRLGLWDRIESPRTIFKIGNWNRAVVARRAKEGLRLLSAEFPETGHCAKRSARVSGQIRVLHYLTNSIPFTQSGYTVRSHHVLQAQRRSGLTVRAVTRLAYPLIIGKISRREIDVIEGVGYQRLIPALYPIGQGSREELSSRMLAKVAEEFRPAILHTTTNNANARIVANAASQLGVPWVYEVRGEMALTWLSKFSTEERNIAENSAFLKASMDAEYRAARAASAVVVLSEVSKRRLVEQGVEPSKITVIPNGIDRALVDMDFDKTTIRRELNMPDGFLVGIISSLVAYEGIDVLINAIELLPEKFKLVVVGEGAARQDLEELVRQLNLNNRVLFAGRVPSGEVWKWYASLDVFVVPRKDFEVCRWVTPIKPMMAQALGVPVVCSDLPALREITGGQAAYVTPEDPVELSRAIEKVANDPQSAIRERNSLYSHTWEEFGARYRRLYGSLISAEA